MNDDAADDADGTEPKNAKPKTRTVYGKGAVFPDVLVQHRRAKSARSASTRSCWRKPKAMIPNKKREVAAEELRRVVATVGKQGQPGEHVRCVVSVSMLTEGWDANNVTHVLGHPGLRQPVLCEQVVGRGLRRMDYTPDPKTGLLTEEYVDVYGIPFSVIPFKGRTDQTGGAGRQAQEPRQGVAGAAAI